MISAIDANKILERSLKPRQDQIVDHCLRLSRKIKIAARLKQDSTRYEVICDMMTVKQTSAIAVMVGLEMKKKGFKVKIRENELIVSWKKTLS